MFYRVIILNPVIFTEIFFKMKAILLSIGDEILIGQIVNTNTVWLATQLNLLGIDVIEMLTIADDALQISTALQEAMLKAELIIITGGLGPTKDDLTKDVLTDFFKTNLVLNQDVYNRLEAFFAAKGILFNEPDKTQCYVPASCKVLMNYRGTAPGMLFHENEKILVSLPGVPSEMQSIFEQELIPYLRSHATLPPICHRTFLTGGISESALFLRLTEWENNLPKDLKLAYLPSGGQVRLRLTSKNADGNAKQRIADAESQLINLLGDDIVGFDDDTIASVIQRLCIKKGKTLVTAESCTGGYIAHQITSVPGASAYYQGSIIAYHNKIKAEILGVPDEILQKHGAVSAETVQCMAENVRRKMEADYAIAISGIAGPDGGTSEKPVGTVWIAWTDGKQTITRRFNFGKNRQSTIERTSQEALFGLRQFILGMDL